MHTMYFDNIHLLHLALTTPVSTTNSFQTVYPFSFSSSLSSTTLTGMRLFTKVFLPGTPLKTDSSAPKSHQLFIGSQLAINCPYVLN